MKYANVYFITLIKMTEPEVKCCEGKGRCLKHSFPTFPLLLEFFQKASSLRYFWEEEVNAEFEVLRVKPKERRASQDIRGVVILFFSEVKYVSRLEYVTSDLKKYASHGTKVPETACLPRGESYLDLSSWDIFDWSGMGMQEALKFVCGLVRERAVDQIQVHVLLGCPETPSSLPPKGVIVTRLEWEPRMPDELQGKWRMTEDHLEAFKVIRAGETPEEGTGEPEIYSRPWDSPEVILEWILYKFFSYLEDKGYLKE